MNEKQVSERHIERENDEGEMRLIDLLIVLAKHKKRIFQISIAAAAGSALISFVLPNTYVATTRLLPPQQTQSSAAALLSQLGGIAGAAAASATGLKNPNDLYVGMLKSRTVADRLVSEFDLKKVYDTDSLEKARKKLEANTSIGSGKDGLITIEVEDHEQKRVAELANAYVKELFRLMKTLAVTDASQRRLFYEQQLQVTKNNLATAEIDLKKTMDARGVVSVDAESRAILETIARLKAQTSAKEIQLTAMRSFVTTTNPDYRRVEEEWNGMRAELSRLENGRGESNDTNEKSGGLENIKLLRELKYQQMLYEVLAKQYEVARIDEAKDPSVIQVLDPAVQPERPKPRYALVIILSTLVAFLSAAFWAIFKESQGKTLRSGHRAAQLAELRAHLGLRNSSSKI